MAEILPETKRKKIRYFNEAQTDLSAVLGGPVPAGIMFYKNFKVLKRPKDALFSLLATFIFTVLLIVLLIKLPAEILDKIPNFVFTAVWGIAAALLYRSFLKKDINELDKEEYVRASNWAVAGYTILGIVIFFSIGFLIAISQPAFPGERVPVGETDNEVYYQGYVTENNIQTLVYTLQDLGYFSVETANAVQIKHNKDKYTVTLSVSKSVWEDPEINSAIMILKNELRLQYDSEVRIILEDYNLMGNRLTKEF